MLQNLNIKLQYNQKFDISYILVSTNEILFLQILYPYSKTVFDIDNLKLEIKKHNNKYNLKGRCKIQCQLEGWLLL